jgi:anaerobic selenocysteine-containing dehydrogenase
MDRKQHEIEGKEMDKQREKFEKLNSVPHSLMWAHDEYIPKTLGGDWATAADFNEVWKRWQATYELKQQLSDCQAKLKRYEDAFNEPVAWIARHKLDDDRYQIPLIFTTLEEATRWKNQYKDGYAWLYELFTKPEGE